MAWATLIVGALGGLATGWRAGRLHQHARHRVDAWRGAVDAVPPAWRAAVDSVKKAVTYIAAVVLLIVCIALFIWKAR